MATIRFLVAFFRAAPPVTRPMVLCLWGTAVVGGVAMFAGVAGAATVLTPLLVLHIFAASSGFGLALRRGHYDLVLSRGIGLAGLMTAHWMASIAPGLGAWIAVAVFERLLPAADPAAAASGTVLAFLLASSLPWALTTPLPRFGAAIGWLVLLVTSLAMVPSGQLQLADALRNPRPNAIGALAVVTYPMGLLGLDAWQLPAGTVSPGLACAIASMLGALAWHRRAEVPLETAA
ncbi:MAG TPA: hypothetical protein VFD69_08205 [Vicinamibacterales bacterium]|nr:hypothetical protein [Vicinamibacterales bacterium]